MLGRNIKSLRDALGWKQYELAHKAGMPQATLSRIERGVIKSPNIEEVARIARAFGCTIDNLMKGE